MDDLNTVIGKKMGISLSHNTAIFEADLCTSKTYFAYFCCTLILIKDSYLDSILRFLYIINLRA